MANYTYDVAQSNLGPIVSIYKDGELLIYQDRNPETGKPFTDVEEAENYAKSVITELTMQDALEDAPTLRVRFLNPDTDEVIRVAKVGDPIKVSVELYYPVSETEKVYAPVTGDYIVPYYADDTQAGSAVIHIENGKGEGILRINKSGVFEIKLDKILNAETMQQPSPLPKLEENPKIAIVEEVENPTS